MEVEKKASSDQLRSAVWVSDGRPETLSTGGEMDDAGIPGASARLALRGHLGRRGLCADAAKVLKQANTEPRTKPPPFLGSSPVGVCSGFEKGPEGKVEAKSQMIL